MSQNWNKKWTKIATHFSEPGWKYIPPVTDNPKKEFDLIPGGGGRKCEWCDFIGKTNEEVEEHAVKDHNDVYLTWKNKQQHQIAETRIYDFYFFEHVEPDRLRDSLNYGKGFAQSDYSDAMPEEKGTETKDTEWERIIENLHQAKRDLIETMGRDYMEDLRFSISCELRHLWSNETGKWAGKSVSLNDGWLNSSDNWLTRRLKVAEEIEASKKPSDNPEVNATKNAIIKLKSIDMSSLPENIRKSYQEQIRSLEAHLKKISGGMGREYDQISREYLDHLIQHYLVDKAHEWRVSKIKETGSDDDDDDGTYWTEWKKDQLSRMVKLILGTSVEEWKTIIEKVKKFKHLLCNEKNPSKFVVPGNKSLRYRKSSSSGEGHNSKYYQAYLKAHEAGFTNRELSIFGTAALLDVDWSGSYGGPPWAHISSMANRVNELFNNELRGEESLGKESQKSAIDQAHNLQHNNGSAFTKIDMIYNGNMFEEALNFKASKTTSAYDLLEKASPQLYEIGQFYLYQTGNHPPKDAVERVNEMSYVLKEKSNQNELCDFLINTDFRKITGSMTDSENAELEKLKQIPGINEAIKLYDLKQSGGKGNEELIQSLVNSIDKSFKSGNQLSAPTQNKVKRIKELEGKAKISGIRDLLWSSPIDYSCLAQNKFFGPGDRGYFLTAINRIAHNLPSGTLDMKQIQESFYKYQKFSPDESIEIITELEEQFANMENAAPAFLGQEGQDIPEEIQEEEPETSTSDLIDSGMQTESVPESVTFFDEPEQQGIKSSYTYKWKKEAQANFVDYINFGANLTSQLMGLAQNINLKMDSYYKIFDIAQKKQDYEVLLALAKNPAIKKTKDEHGLQLKQILLDMDFPKWFIEKKLPSKGKEQGDWEDNTKIDLEKISNLFSVLSDNISAITNAIIDTNVEDYEYKGQTLSKVIGSFSINDTKFAILEAKETSDKCKLTMIGDDWKGNALYPINDIPEIVKIIIDIIHNVEAGKPVTIGTGSKLPALNAKLIITSEIKDLMDTLLKETSLILEQENTFKDTYGYSSESYTITEDKSDIKEATYVFNTPNQIYVVFENQDYSIVAKLTDMLSKQTYTQNIDFGSSGIIIKELSQRFATKIKQYNIGSLESLGNEIFGKVKTLSQLKINKVFNFPTYSAVDLTNKTIFSCILDQSSIIIKKTNGESKTFFSINADDMSEYILEGMPTAADSYKKVAMVINGVANNLKSNNINAVVKKESELKFRYMINSSEELAKLIYSYETNKLVITFYPIEGYCSTKFAREFSLNDSEENVIFNISAVFLDNVSNAKGAPKSQTQVVQPVPKQQNQVIPTTLPSSLDPYTVSESVAEYLKEKVQDDNVEEKEVFTGDKKKYDIITKTDEGSDVALVTLTFDSEDIVIDVHEYPNYIKTTQDGTFPYSFAKDNNLAGLIITFLNSYIVYASESGVKKQKIKAPEPIATEPVAPAANFVSNYGFTSPVTWGITFSDQWAPCLQVIDNVYASLSTTGKGVVVIPEANIGYGILKIKVKMNNVDIGAIKTSKTSAMVEYDDASGAFKTVSVDYANALTVASEIVNHFKEYINQ